MGDTAAGMSAFEQQQLRHLEFLRLQDRLGHLFTRTTTNNYGGSTTKGLSDLKPLWDRIGPHPRWLQLMSPEQLSLLLSFDERLEYRCGEDLTQLPPGFIECVLSRLPRLQRCVLSNVELACNHPELLTAPLLCERPFPELRHLDLRRSSICDDELAALLRIMPRLETCDVRGCFNLSWAGMEAALRLASAEGRPHLALQPATQEEKAGEHDWLFALYGCHLNQAEGGLLGLWRAVQADESGNLWEGMMNPAQLNMLMHHDLRESFRVEGADNEGLVCDTMKNILSRLPRLHTIVLRHMKVCLSVTALWDIPNPFPELRELYIEDSDVEARLVLDLVKTLPNLEVLGLKGCYKVSWRVLELARATCGARLRVLPDSREEKMKADEAAQDAQWLQIESSEAQHEFSRLSREYRPVLRKMEAAGTTDTIGPWLLWKELGGAHHWRSHLRPAQLTLLLSRDKTTTMCFAVNLGTVRERDTSSGSGDGEGGGGGGGSTAADSGSPSTNTRSAMSDQPTEAPQLDTGEVCSYFTHAVARLPLLQELTLDACPVWPFSWKHTDDRVTVPFPQLRRVRLRRMTCHAKDLRDLVRYLPMLAKGEEDSEDNGILVDSAYVQCGDYTPAKLRQMCCGKVSVCHPDGSWHALSDLPH
ncbi:hypothetical protein NESM_000852400 [Novymonas esmeraldas]|uniref:Uncharacterized protein n=1 Tax=Novymonas esmeraldas TaxID=1808958 RepID=A0AAW0F0L0_9TRYP